MLGPEALRRKLRGASLRHQMLKGRADGGKDPLESPRVDAALDDEAFDDEGYFKTGDMGKLDADGHLYITGRIKEILITAAGEHVAPVRIEAELKKQLPCLSNAMGGGDQKKRGAVW